MERKLSMSTAPRSGFNARSTATDERGLSTVEYVVLLVLVVAACIGLWVSFGKDLRDKLTTVNSAFEQVTFQPGSAPNTSSGGSAPPTGVGAVHSPTAEPVVAPLAETAPAKTKEDR
jgi:Flp pilus assembly pilin Flp